MTSYPGPHVSSYHGREHVWRDSPNCEHWQGHVDPHYTSYYEQRPTTAQIQTLIGITGTPFKSVSGTEPNDLGICARNGAGDFTRPETSEVLGPGSPPRAQQWRGYSQGGGKRLDPGSRYLPYYYCTVQVVRNCKESWGLVVW